VRAAREDIAAGARSDAAQKKPDGQPTVELAHAGEPIDHMPEEHAV